MHATSDNWQRVAPLHIGRAVFAVALVIAALLWTVRTSAADDVATARTMVDRITTLATAADARELVAIDDETLVRLWRNLGRLGIPEERVRLCGALAASPHFPALTRRIRSLTAITLLRSSAVPLDPAAARLLDEVAEFPPFLEFLALRRYEPLWPAIEARVGPRLEGVARDLMALRSSEWRARRRDHRRQLQLALIQYQSGDFAGVVELARTIDHRARGIARLDEDEAWILNVEANALDALGRTTEAGRVMELIGTPPRRPDNAWAISFRINRTERLLALGEWAAALAASQAAIDAVELGDASAYGRAEAYSRHACALIAMGRGADAAPYLVALDRGWSSHPVAAADAALCAGATDRAARIVIAALQDVDRQAGVVLRLQAPEFWLSPGPGAFPTLGPALRTRPDVAAAFAAVAREIPAAFTPVMGSLRRPLPVRVPFPRPPPANPAALVPAVTQ